MQMATALQPALESKENAVVDKLEQMLDNLGDGAGF